MILKVIIFEKENGEDYHAVEVPMLDIMTQGEDVKDSLAMAIDAIESLEPKLKGKIRGEAQSLTDAYISCDDSKLIGLILQRQRLASGLSVREAAEKLGFKSHNSISAYEQGEREPTISKLNQILSAYGKEFEWGIAKAG